TQAALAAREATRGMDRVWENIAVASAWDAAREAVRLLGPDYGQTLRQRLESAALASASVLANLG
ncbi:MAG TPA: hypothetical protein VNM16_10220, partial [Bacillota bacterium]|nr:hypothetical protein [Bacillota bacterium]